MKLFNEMGIGEAAGIRYVLMDIDDTLTTGGKLSAPAYTALWRLHEAGLKVIPITGRPAGWCDLIAREWPVDAVVGENGALVFWEVHTASSGVGSSRSERKSTSLHSRPEGTPVHAASGRKRILKQEFHPDAVRNDHPVLQKIKERALAEVPGLRIAKDQFARLFDLALDFAEEEPILSLETAEQVRTIAEEEGAQAKISSIHVNIWMGNYDKLSMTRRFLQNRFVPCDQLFDDSSVLFVGDSPNDEPMFARFPLACAVANISRYKGFIQHLPTFVSQKECGEGFAEIVETLLEKRQLYR